MASSAQARQSDDHGLAVGEQMSRPAALALAEAAMGEDGTTLLDSTVQTLGPFGLGPVTAEATLLHSSTTRRVWHVVLRDQEGTALAAVSQTYGPVPPDVVPLHCPAEAPTSIAEDRRRRLLDAALPVIAARGFANATMREIAAAGLHVPTMYQYARSKDHLLLMIFEDALVRSEAEMRAIASRPASATDRLRAAVSLLMDKSERRRAEIRLFSREAVSLPPRLRSQMHRRWAAVLANLETILRDGIANGEFADVEPETTAHLIESLCEAWSLRRFVMRRHGLDQLTALVQRLLATGLQPDRRAA